jgi:hypothetical protein
VLYSLGTVLPTGVFIYCILVPRYLKLTGSVATTVILGGLTYTLVHFMDDWTLFNSPGNAVLTVVFHCTRDDLERPGEVNGHRDDEVTHLRRLKAARMSSKGGRECMLPGGRAFEDCGRPRGLPRTGGAGANPRLRSDASPPARGQRKPPSAEGQA